jgi:hypothetical protein
MMVKKMSIEKYQKIYFSRWINEKQKKPIGNREIALLG